MSSKSKTKSELNSRIVGSKLWLIWLWLSAGIVCLADIAVLVVLGIEGVQGAVYALPIVFLVLDVIITILSAVTNFRFKRALAAPIVYAVLKLVVVAMAMWMFLGDTVIFSTTAITLWLVFEFFSIACIILSVVFAKGSGHGFLAVVAVFTVAIIAFGAVYMVFVSTSGFFGQNKERTFEKRTLVYSYYDDNRDSLVASDVLDGNGNTIVVPAEFNGMEVKGVDCTLFAQDGVDTVVLRCSEDVEFQNTEELCYMGDDVSIYADPDCIDTYREFFYSLSIDEIEKSAGVSTYSRRSTPKSLAEAYAAFANSMYPEVEDGEDGEGAADNVYVTVEIDYRYLPAFKNGDGEYEIPAVWIADRGSVFDPYEIYGYGYTEHMDEGSEIDLCWCYYNFSNYILTDFTGPDGKSVVGKEISDSVTVSVKMAEIYAVEVGDGNDAVHTEPGLNRDFYGGYRYVTESTADEIMDEVTKRTGFTLSWEYSLSGSETRRAFTTLVGRLSDGMTIYPVWTMEAPKISASADSYTVVYGNTVKFDSDGSFADDEVALAYVWTHGSDTESEEQRFEKENMDPTKDGGTYTVTVTAGGDGITSLTTTASASVYITVNKRNLVLEWSTTSSSVYSGYDETVSVRALESASPATETSGVIYGDGVTFTLDRSEIIKDAGIYDFEATLTSFTDYYVISENAKWSFTIAKYTLYVVWHDETLIYTASEQHHGYSYTDAGGVPITALGGDTFGVDLLGEKVSGTGTNAGNHTATLSITNANYELAAGTEKDEYTIEQKEVTVTWSPADSYIYKGEAQYPEATPSGILDSEEGTVKLTYSGYGTDVGTYTVTLGISSGNYKLVAGGDDESALSYTYTIVPKPIEITWQETRSFEYDGHEYTIRATISDADVEAIDKGLITLSYSGDVTGIINASDSVYTVYAAVANTGTSDRARNYTISNSQETFTITKKSGFSIVAQSLVKEHYDGESFADSETYKYSGLAETDDGAEVVRVTEVVYSVENPATALSAAPVNVGEYIVTIYLSEGDKIGNYDYTVPSYITGSITINEATLYLAWNDESLFYNGESQHITAKITSGLVANENVTLYYSVQKEQGGDDAEEYADAGDYYVTVFLGEDGSNYEIYVDGDFTVTKTYQIATYDIEITWGKNTLEYNGEAQVPSYSYDGTIWCAGDVSSFLEVSGHVTDVGSGTAEITSSNSNYTFSNSSCDFEVVAKVVTVTWENARTYTYNGSEQAPSATIDGDQLYARDGTVDIMYTYSSGYKPTNVDYYEVTAKLSCYNYVIDSANDSVEFEIVAQSLTIEWQTDGYSSGYEYYEYTYAGTEYKPTYSSVTGIVDGKPAADIIEVTYYEIVNGTRGDKSVTPVNAGTYVVVAESIDSNYYLHEEREIVINPEPVTVTVTWDENTSFTYDGTQVGYVPEVTLSETGLEFKVSYVYTSEGTTLDGAPKDAGTYTLTVTVSISDGNYVLDGTTEFSKNYEIKARELSVSEGTGTPQTFDYSGDATKPSYTVEGRVEGENGSIKETYYASDNSSDPLSGAPVNVGSYVLVLTSDDPNYSMNVSIPFEIQKTKLSVEVSQDQQSLTYDGNGQTPAYTVTGVKGENVSTVEAYYAYSGGGYTSLEGAPANVGTYVLILTSDDSNYSLYAVIWFVIVPMPVTPVVTWSETQYTYDGDAKEHLPGMTIENLICGTDYTVEYSYSDYQGNTSLSVAPTNVGEYTVTVTITLSNANYELTAWEFQDNYQITKRAITVTAEENQSFEYDGSAKSPSYTTEGILEGDKEKAQIVETYYASDNLTTPLTEAPVDAGKYVLVLTTEDPNYSLDVSISFEITPAILTATVEWNTEDYTYDGGDKTPEAASITISGVSIDFTKTYVYKNADGVVCTPKNAGYTVELTIELANHNYALKTATFTHEFTIKTAELTINWAYQESYSSSDGTNHPTAQVEGAVSGKTVTVSYTYYYDDGDLYGDGTTAPNVAGSYKVVITLEYSGSKGNYTVTGSCEQNYTIVAG